MSFYSNMHSIPKYQIIADEADFMVVSKSANVHFHSQNGQAGVVATIEKDLNSKLYPVHRLDTVTSGLLVFAKSAAAANDFTQMFSQHRVQKYYLALAKGKPKKKQGSIIGDMAKSRRSQYKLLRTLNNPAITQFFSQSVSEGVRLYLLKPLTGKTHQLRVALAGLGTPILGDKLYGGDESDRTYLHAWQLDFTYKNKQYLFSVLPKQGEVFQLLSIRNQLEQWQPVESLLWPKKR